jgi:hypothetical protein
MINHNSIIKLNNYNSIIEYLPEVTDGNFLFLQIVRRQKDVKDKKVKESSLYSKLIYNQKQLEEIMPMVIAICESMQARAYINLTPKSNEALRKNLAKQFVEEVCENNQTFPARTFNKVVGSLEGKRNERYWMLDIDNDGKHAITLARYNKIIEWVQYENVFVDTIRSPHGIHIIVKPFNLKKWKEDNMPDIDIHKNSMGTILYYPSSIEE